MTNPTSRRPFLSAAARSRLLLVVVFLGLSSGLSRPSFAQQKGTDRDASAQPMGDDRPMEPDAELGEAAEDPVEPPDVVPVRRSFLAWFLGSLGWRYTLLLPVATFLSFVMLLVILLRGRGWAAGAAAVLLVPLPMLVGLMGTIDGLIQSYMVIAYMEFTPRPQAIAEGISSGLVSSFAGFCLMVPNYWLAVIGLIVRSMRNEQEAA